jgi:hypothetical protein
MSANFVMLHFIYAETLHMDNIAPDTLSGHQDEAICNFLLFLTWRPFELPKSQGNDIDRVERDQFKGKKTCILLCLFPRFVGLHTTFNPLLFHDDYYM